MQVTFNSKKHLEGLSKCIKRPINKPLAGGLIGRHKNPAQGGWYLLGYKSNWDENWIGFIKNIDEENTTIK